MKSLGITGNGKETEATEIAQAAPSMNSLLNCLSVAAAESHNIFVRQ